VRVNADRTALSGEIWEIMKTTPNLNIDTPLRSFKSTVSPSATIGFPVSYQVSDYNVEGKGTLRFSPDGRQISEMLITTTTTDPKSGEVLQKDEQRVGPFSIYEADKETETQRAHLYYTIPSKNRDVFGTVKSSVRDVSARDDGSCCKYGAFTERPVENITREMEQAKTTIHFNMTDEAIDKKRATSKRLHEEKKQQKETISKAAAAGGSWAGPFGAEEKIEGTIKLDISLKEKVVSGSFRGTRMEGEDRKYVLSGEFQGMIDPGSNEISATLNKSTMWAYRLEKGTWIPASLVPEDLARETRLVGKVDGNKVTGHLELDGKKGFAWSAQPVAEGEKK